MSLPRIVIDTNTLLRGILSDTSAAAKLRRAAEDRLVIPLLSKPVIDEYRAVLGHPDLRERFSKLSAKKVSYLIHRLLYIGEYVKNPHAHFEYARDPRDQKFIELAIELAATHLISSDKDLLALAHGADRAGKWLRQRLPQLKIMDAGTFLHSRAEWKRNL